MIEKIDLYDILTAELHGVLFLAYMVVFFPSAFSSFGVSVLPEAAVVMVFVALAYFWGQVLSALASLLQKILYLSWGGAPSDIVLGKGRGCGFMSADSIARVMSVLKAKCGSDASVETMFSMAMVISRKAEGSLSERHNRVYAYYRIALTNLILCIFFFVVSCFVGWGIALTWPMRISCGIVIVFLIVLHWFRVRQRAFYYVREVLLVAMRELEGASNGV